MRQIFLFISIGMLVTYIAFAKPGDGFTQQLSDLESYVHRDETLLHLHPLATAMKDAAREDHSISRLMIWSGLSVLFESSNSEDLRLLSLLLPLFDEYTPVSGEDFDPLTNRNDWWTWPAPDLSLADSIFLYMKTKTMLTERGSRKLGRELLLHFLETAPKGKRPELVAFLNEAVCHDSHESLIRIFTRNRKGA